MTLVTKRRIVLFLIVASFGMGEAYAQNRCTPQPPRQSYHWFFSQGAAISFDDTGFTGSATNNPLGQLTKGSSSISDSLGNLLLITDGEKLFNGNFQEITITEILYGNAGATQSSVIIPRPGDHDRFFVFTVDLHLQPLPPAEFNHGFRFTEVDLSGSAGTLVPGMINKLLQPKVSQKITAVRHFNDTDFWVVTHDLNSAGFYSYRVTSAGVDTIPVISTVGTSHDGEDDFNNATGYMKLSPDGSRIAVAVFGKGLLEIFDFNNNTGDVSFERSIPIQPGTYPYGIAFSPNSRYLYFTTLSGLSVPPLDSYMLYQFDFQNPGAAPVSLNQNLTHDVTALQLGSDGRIYVGRWEQPYLGVIQNPNRGGVFSSYIEDAISLQFGNSRLGLPNFPACFLHQPHFYYDPSCVGDLTTFRLVNDDNIEATTIWDFGDTGGTQVGFDVLSPSFIFSAPGTYTVTVTENGNPNYSFSEEVVINPLPFPLPGLPPADTMFFHFPQSVLQIDGGPGYYSYLWEENIQGTWVELGSERYHDFNYEGHFRITVEDQLCCVNSREFYILTVDVNFPNAFTPDQPSNNLFRARGGQNIHNFEFSVFNRWGQMVHHESHAMGTGVGWDGWFKGSPAPTGIYTYIAVFEVEHEGAMSSQTKKGTVMLLR